jgi:hypothetical protein
MDKYFLVVIHSSLISISAGEMRTRQNLKTAEKELLQ